MCVFHLFLFIKTTTIPFHLYLFLKIFIICTRKWKKASIKYINIYIIHIYRFCVHTLRFWTKKSRGYYWQSTPGSASIDFRSKCLVNEKLHDGKRDVMKHLATCNIVFHSITGTSDLFKTRDLSYPYVIYLFKTIQNKLI